MIYQSESGDISMLMAGEAMLSRRLSVFTEREYFAGVELNRKAVMNQKFCRMVWPDGVVGGTAWNLSPPARRPISAPVSKGFWKGTFRIPGKAGPEEANSPLASHSRRCTSPHCTSPH